MSETCRNFDGLIARSAQLTTEEAATLEAHLASCASCRELVRAMKPVEDAAFAATGTLETVLSGDAAPGRRDAPLPEAATDRYRITGEVGRGGIGRVLRALDRVLDRPVALKELFSASASTRRRFIREALITARLQHPSIVPVYDAGHLDDRSPFYAMKLVAGRPLDKAIAEAATVAQRLALLPNVLAVADAIAYAHSERIIHRDLKPTNVLVGTYGETIVIDWGLAKDLAIDDRDALDPGPYRAADVDQTVAGAVMGTPAYMAPEQASGDAVDERADVYALGAILYHVVSGEIPHEGTTFDEMVDRVITGDVRPLTARVPDVPRDLAAIVAKAMALAPSERYANARGLADDLRRFLNGQLVASHAYGARELVRRWIKRHRGAVTVALAALVVVGVVGIASVLRIVRAKQEADDSAALAKREENSATEALADMLTEQGRQELLAGQPARAAVYLSEAQGRGHDPRVALRSLLADAMRSIDAQRLSLEGHHRAVLSAAFSPDGRRIVTAGLDRTTRVWDAATGTLVATMAGRVSSASFSPDSTRIVTAGRGAARLWDARTGKLVATLDNGDVRSAAFSPDGALVVTAGSGGVASLWDARTGQLHVSLTGHGDTLTSAAFSADGARVITMSRDYTANVSDARTGAPLVSLDGRAGGRAAFSPDGSQIITAGGVPVLWNARTGKLVASLEGHSGYITSVAYSPDGLRVVTASDDHTAKIWDTRLGTLLVSLDGHTAAVQTAVFSPDGSRIATASADHTARLWEVRTGKLLASFEGHRDGVASAMFSPDGTQVVTASADGTAKVWNVTSNKLRVPLAGITGLIAGGRFSDDGARLVTAASDTAMLWDVRSGALLATFGHHGAVSFAGFDPAGKRVVTASFDQTVKLWDAGTGKLLVSLEHPDHVHYAKVSPDGSRVITAGSDHGARIWKANSGELIARIDGTELPHMMPDPDEVHSAAFSPDGGRVVTGSGDGTGRIWSAETGTLIVQLDGHEGPVTAVAFSHDGERVATASEDRTTNVWDARTGKLVAALEGHTEPVTTVRFSADGARVVTASADHTAKLWDAQSGKLLASFDALTSEVRQASFSPDGLRVVTASADHTVKLWDARSGKLLGSFDGHTDELLDVAFSPDGTRITTASRDGTIGIWDVHLEARDPDAIRRLIGARDPWTLSNGGLVPVPVASRTVSSTGDQNDATEGAVTSSDDYTAKLAALAGLMVDVLDETDCDKLAARLQSYNDANRAQMKAIAAWANTHAVDKSAVAKAVAPKMKDLQRRLIVFDTCKYNKAFAAALDAANATFK